MTTCLWTQHELCPGSPSSCGEASYASAPKRQPRQRLGRCAEDDADFWPRRRYDRPSASRPAARSCRRRVGRRHPIRRQENHMAPTIAVIAAGEMGSGIAARLTRHGVTVLTSLEGRSAKSRARAEAAGMQDADDQRLIEAADMMLSIVPPAAAS